MTDTAKLIAQAREPLTPREAEELCDRLAEALEAAEAETKETWLSLHARAVKAEEALGAAEALKDDATMLWNDANKRAVAAENDRDNWKELYDLALARANKNEAENTKLRKELDLAMLALDND